MTNITVSINHTRRLYARARVCVRVQKKKRKKCVSAVAYVRERRAVVIASLTE